MNSKLLIIAKLCTSACQLGTRCISISEYNKYNLKNFPTQKFFPFFSAMRQNRVWPTFPRKHLLNELVSPASTCVEQSTRWSACSQSCGAGVSTRVSNQNPACKLQMETRLCKVRPCRASQSGPWKPVVRLNYTFKPTRTHSYCCRISGSHVILASQISVISV